MIPTAENLSKLPFFPHLSEREREDAAANATIRHFPVGSRIYNDDSSCLGMAYVLRGSIRTYLLSEEGREITLFRLEEGSPCVISASCVINQITFDTQMVVEEDCDLLVVNSAAFRRLSDGNIHVKCFMYELMTDRFSSVMWSMQQILFAKFDQRLAAFLLSEYDRTGSRTVRMTHEQIARQISSAREVVARMLKRFASDGLVEMKRGSILLRDIEKLRNI